jgi:hypothetical protein
MEDLFDHCTTKTDAAFTLAGATQFTVKAAISALQSTKQGVNHQRASNRALDLLTRLQKYIHDFESFKSNQGD